MKGEGRERSKNSTQVSRILGLGVSQHGDGRESGLFKELRKGRGLVSKVSKMSKGGKGESGSQVQQVVSAGSMGIQ